MFKLLNLKTKELNKNLLNEILNLKDTHWRNGIISQKKFFEKNVYKNDDHILLFCKNRLAGYVLLRSKKCFKKKVKINYFHFDTLIVKKSYRKKAISSFLMSFVANFIKHKKSISILYCDKGLVKFYLKHGWKIDVSSTFNLSLKKSNKKQTLFFE